MKLIKKKLINLSDYTRIFFMLTLLMIQSNTLNSFAQEDYISDEMEIINSTKSDYEKNIDIPSNPFQIVEMIRRSNSMNDATKPSDAIDDALKSFNMIKDTKK